MGVCERVCLLRELVVPKLEVKVAKYVSCIFEEKWKAREWEICFGGEGAEEHRPGGVLWAEMHWIFCDDSNTTKTMVSDFIDELTALDMEPKPEPLWLTSRTWR